MSTEQTEPEQLVVEPCPRCGELPALLDGKRDHILLYAITTGPAWMRWRVYHMCASYDLDAILIDMYGNDRDLILTRWNGLVAADRAVMEREGKE